MQPASKRQELYKTYNVSVIGLSGAAVVNADGVGKSCLCNRFMYSREDDFSTEHDSMISMSDFATSVINHEHWLWWGTVTKRVENSECQFSVVEQTEFIDDMRCQPFACTKDEPTDYAKRCLQRQLRSQGKCAYIRREQLAIEDSYARRCLPDGSIRIEGYLVVYDITVNGKQREAQTRFVNTVVGELIKHKVPFALASTKNDATKPRDAAALADLTALLQRRDVKALGSVARVETSAKLNVNVDLAFANVVFAIERLKPKVAHSLSYAEAEKIVKERLDQQAADLRRALQAHVTDHRATFESLQRSCRAGNDPSGWGAQLAVLLNELGRRRAANLFEAHKEQLRAQLIDKRVAQYLSTLQRDALPALLGDLSLIRSHGVAPLKWSVVIERVLPRCANVERYLVPPLRVNGKSASGTMPFGAFESTSSTSFDDPDDQYSSAESAQTAFWRVHDELLSVTRDTRVPFAFLTAYFTETEHCYMQHVARLERDEQRVAARGFYTQLLRGIDESIPLAGRSLEECAALIERAASNLANAARGKLELELLTQGDRADLFEVFQREVRERVRREFVELLVERIDVFERFLPPPDAYSDAAPLSASFTSLRSATDSLSGTSTTFSSRYEPLPSNNSASAGRYESLANTVTGASLASISKHELRDVANALQSELRSTRMRYMLDEQQRIITSYASFLRTLHEVHCPYARDNSCGDTIAQRFLQPLTTPDSEGDAVQRVDVNVDGVLPRPPVRMRILVCFACGPCCEQSVAIALRPLGLEAGKAADGVRVTLNKALTRMLVDTQLGTAAKVRSTVCLCEYLVTDNQVKKVLVELWPVSYHNAFKLAGAATRSSVDVDLDSDPDPALEPVTFDGCMLVYDANRRASLAHARSLLKRISYMPKMIVATVSECTGNNMRPERPGSPYEDLPNESETEALLTNDVLRLVNEASELADNEQLASFQMLFASSKATYSPFFRTCFDQRDATRKALASLIARRLAAQHANRPVGAGTLAGSRRLSSSVQAGLACFDDTAGEPVYASIEPYAADYQPPERLTSRPANSERTETASPTMRSRPLLERQSAATARRDRTTLAVSNRPECEYATPLEVRAARRQPDSLNIVHTRSASTPEQHLDARHSHFAQGVEIDTEYSTVRDQLADRSHTQSTRPPFAEADTIALRFDEEINAASGSSGSGSVAQAEPIYSQIARKTTLFAGMRSQSSDSLRQADTPWTMRLADDHAVPNGDGPDQLRIAIASDGSNGPLADPSASNSTRRSLPSSPSPVAASDSRPQDDLAHIDDKLPANRSRPAPNDASARLNATWLAAAQRSFVASGPTTPDERYSSGGRPQRSNRSNPSNGGLLRTAAATNNSAASRLAAHTRSGSASDDPLDDDDEEDVSGRSSLQIPPSGSPSAGNSRSLPRSTELTAVNTALSGGAKKDRSRHGLSGGSFRFGKKRVSNAGSNPAAPESDVADSDWTISLRDAPANADGIPLLLLDALGWLEQFALDCEGLYRTSCAKGDSELLLDAVRANRRIDFVALQQAYAARSGGKFVSAQLVASFVKHLLQRLDEPLVPRNVLGEVIGLASDNNNQLGGGTRLSSDGLPPGASTHEKIKQLLMLRISKQQWHVLRTIVLHLSRLAANVRSKMTPENIAICLVPTLFRLELSSFEEMTTWHSPCVRLLEVLIMHSSFIFAEYSPR